MITDRAYRISYRPSNKTQSENEAWQERWTVPDEILERNECNKALRLSFGGFSVDESPFGFTLRNPAKDSFWLSTKDRNLVLSDKYIEIGFEVHSQNIFGWGERTRDFKLIDGEYTSWATSRDNGNDPGKRGYGKHGDYPFVLARNNDKSFIGIFFKNSNAKVLKIITESQGRSVINFRSVGGIVDVYAFAGDTAEEVLQQFHKVIGEPYLPPLWALGWQQGSASYKTDADALTAYNNYINNGIPLEVLWIDEQYMNKFRIFELSPNFKNLKTLSSTLSKGNRKLGISIHPGIAVYDSSGKISSYYTSAWKDGVFIRASKNSTEFGDVLIGEGLPGKVAYLDFFNPYALVTWDSYLKDLHDLTGFHTIQLNMNEITQF